MPICLLCVCVCLCLFQLFVSFIHFILSTFFLSGYFHSHINVARIVVINMHTMILCSTIRNVFFVLLFVEKGNILFVRQKTKIHSPLLSVFLNIVSFQKYNVKKNLLGIIFFFGLVDWCVWINDTFWNGLSFYKLASFILAKNIHA